MKYGVWCNPTRIGKRGDDYYRVFKTLEEAKEFWRTHPEADHAYFKIEE